MPTDIKLDEIRPRKASPQALENKRFEQSKNWKAFMFMVYCAVAILLISFTVKFDSPIPDPPIPEEIKNLKDSIVEVDINLDEINFGNDDNGALSKLEPLRKEAPAPEPPSSGSNEHLIASKEADDMKLDTAYNTPKPTNRKPRPTPTIGETPNNNPLSPTPPRRPTAVMSRPGSNGTGGNNAPYDNGISGQGNGSGTGNQGDPRGNPYGTGKKILKFADLLNGGTIADDLRESGTNYKGKVSVTVAVNEKGNYAGLGSIFSSPKNKAAENFVKERVLNKLKFKAGDGNRKAEIVLDFDYN